jgi:hypothetical protein
VRVGEEVKDIEEHQSDNAENLIYVRRTIESVQNAGSSDKDVKLKELEALWCKIESIDPHKEAQELQLLEVPFPPLVLRELEQL